MSKLEKSTKRKIFKLNLKDVLLNRKLLDVNQYQNIQRNAKTQGQSIEQYLVSSGLVPHFELQQAIAASKGAELEFIDHDNLKPSLAISQKLSTDNGYNLIDDYNGLSTFQTIAEGGELSQDWGFCENDNEQNQHTKFVTARDFRQLFIQQNKSELCAQAADLLANKTPDLAAKYGMYLRQKLTLGFVLFTIVAAFINYGFEANYYISIGLSCIFLFASTIKIYSLFLPKTYTPTSNMTAPNLDPAELPIYTILVPMFKEANVIEQLTNNLLNLNYPRSKLDIKLLFEEEDIETIAAAKQLNLPECFEFFVVSECEPKTKPKAMNFVLPFVRGKFLTIYDAEDKPDPNQLLKAVEKFNGSDDKLACLQASLEYENWNENWLARHFFIEYATQFNRYLPALAKLEIPLPLGGTSNHFKTKILREIGGWDAYNVTEDADLGIRLALLGYRAGTLNSITMEEANHRLLPWISQRRRWLKGWVQTIIVHNRHPKKLYDQIGTFRYIGFLALLSGMIFSSLLHPVILLMPFFLYFNFDLNIIMGSGLHMMFFIFSFLTLIIGYGAALLANYQAISEVKRWSLLTTLITAPVYWLLISISAWWALYDYFKDPFFWAKTEHGQSKFINGKSVKKQTT